MNGLTIRAAGLHDRDLASTHHSAPRGGDAHGHGPADPHFSRSLCEFLKANVPSLDALELLCLMYDSSPRAWAHGELVRAMSSDSPAKKHAIEAELARLEAAGVVASEHGRYRVAPRSAHSSQLEALAIACRERPVSLIRLIRFLRDHTIESFADAFRITGN